MLVCTELRRHGSTRVPGHVPCVTYYDGWLCTFTIQQQLDISLAHSWAALFRAAGTVRKRQAVRPVHHIQNHICRVTLLQLARRAAVLDQPSSIRPHWCTVSTTEMNKYRRKSRVHAAVFNITRLSDSFWWSFTNPPKPQARKKVISNLVPFLALL